MVANKTDQKKSDREGRVVFKILFVDDDDRILKGIKRMLWHTDYPWKAVFANSGAEALQMLDQDTYDVIVSDMRMPNMDGASLLAEVRDKYPEVIRIILSGYSEEEAVLRTVGPAHQFLAKPCNSEQLIETINASLNLHQLLKKEEFRKLVGGMKNLPSPPDVYAKFLGALQDEYTSSKTIADIISQDVALTAETLKLTNSAFFGLPQQVRNLEQAVSLLGIETLRALVLVAGFYGQYQGDSESGARIRVLSQRCLEIGMAAQLIAKLLGLEGRDVGFASCAGVLSHIGTLALLANERSRYKQVIQLIEEGGKTVIEAERKVLGCTHQEIGAYLLGVWGFSDPIVAAVAYHHEPSSYIPRVLIPLTAVHLAQEFVKPHPDEATGDAAWIAGMDEAYLKEVGLSKTVPQLLAEFEKTRTWKAH